MDREKGRDEKEPSGMVFWQSWWYEHIAYCIFATKDNHIHDYQKLDTEIWIWFFKVMFELGFAAFFWTYGYDIISGPACWDPDLQFRLTPKRCAIEASFVSGVFSASTVVFIETVWSLRFHILSGRKGNHIDKWTAVSKVAAQNIPGWCQALHWDTLKLMVFSVTCGDGSWSLCNYIAYSLASLTETQSDDAQVGANAAAYYFGALPAFLINATIFCLIHNALRGILILRDSTYGDHEVFGFVWPVDPVYMLIIGGGYWGFGPLSVSIAAGVNATSRYQVALCCMFGTMIGVILVEVTLVMVPIFLFREVALKERQRKNSLLQQNQASMPRIESKSSQEWLKNPLQQAGLELK